MAGAIRRPLLDLDGCYTGSMAATVKEEAHKLIESLPDDATWGDFKYAIYVREKIERGLRSAREEPLLTTEEVFAEFHLDKEA